MEQRGSLQNGKIFFTNSTSSRCLIPKIHKEHMTLNVKKKKTLITQLKTRYRSKQNLQQRNLPPTQCLVVQPKVTASYHKILVQLCSLWLYSNKQKLETIKMSLNEKWIMKTWYIYTMEHNLADKRNDIMNFSGKWMQPEKKHLSE